MRDRVLREVTQFYLNSGDYNGAPLAQIAIRFELEIGGLVPVVTALVEERKLRVLFGSSEVNPHIIRLGFEEIDVQLRKLSMTDRPDSPVSYPTPAHLATVVNRSEYAERPYDLELALGAAQLEFRVFDLSILEDYRNDPRYSYWTNDVGGRIVIRTKHYESEQVPDRDKVLLEHFGFAYDDSLDRAVAAWLRDLSRLSPEHQQRWRTKELSGDYKLHPDFYKAQILGSWDLGMSVFDALIEELKLINRMAQAMGRQPLFRSTDKPRRFGFLIRPTLEEFNTFVHTLDKLLSDNLNKQFFQGEVSDEIEEPAGQGRVRVRNRGTIQMLDLWLNSKFRPRDLARVQEMVRTLKDIRDQRQRPAHTIQEDVFDKQYYRDQRELIQRAYKAVKTLRLILGNHPAAKSVDVLPLLASGPIWMQ